jgi:hypothetical protein
MIELRKAGKNEALRDTKSKKSANSGEAFSKLQKIFILLVTGQEFRFSEKFYIYNIIHSVAINHKNQSDSLHALKKRMITMDHFRITLPSNANPHLAMCELLRANRLNGNISINSFREPNHIKFIFKSK